MASASVHGNVELDSDEPSTAQDHQIPTVPSVDAIVCEEFELDSDNLSCDRAHEPRIPAIPPADAFTFIASFRSEDEAKAYLSRMNNAVTSTTVEGDASQLLYNLLVSGNHSTEKKQKKPHGIHGSLRSEVDALLMGCGPGACLDFLSAKYIDDQETLDIFPEDDQLRNRKSYISKLLRGPSITKYWMNAFNESIDRDEFSKMKADYQNETLVLGSFGDINEASEASFGIVLSTRVLFRNTLYAIRGQSSSGVVGAADGTYKFHLGGWTIVDFGTYGVYYDSKSGVYRHSFFPWAYLFVRSESTLSYSHLFAIVRERTNQFFGSDLNPSFGSLDHASCIALAFKLQWNDISLLNCWPHLTRNARKKAKELLPVSVFDLYDTIIKSQMEYLHLARSPKQFELLATLITSNWDSLVIKTFADWLRTEYLSNPWSTWFITYSQTAGVVPNQNAIESHHKAMKNGAVTLREPTAGVLNVSLNRIMIHAGLKCDTLDSIQYFCGGPLPAEFFLKASQLCSTGNHRFQFKPRTRKKVVEALLFNAHDYLIDADITNINGISLDDSRVTTFLKSLQGLFNVKNGVEVIPSVEDIPIVYLSVHRVCVRDPSSVVHHEWSNPLWSIEEVQSVRNKYLCDCKHFYSTGWVCSHIVASLSLLDGLNISSMIQSLPARKPPGRPRKIPRALEIDSNGGAHAPLKGKTLGKKFYTITNLEKRLLSEPARFINWCTIKEFPTVLSDGRVADENIKGAIGTWMNVEGLYHWKVQFQNGEVCVMNVTELATSLNYAHSVGVTTV